ncbi:haloacid dehalogenase, partial [Candidatus Micrarchaeota archaeon CG11_big_fil_rev_8_21_14_0_20_47_5]
LLAKLRKRGFVLCVATEGIAKKQWDKLIRLGLQDSFDSVFISEELGLNKSPNFYLRICRALGAKPSTCAMIGNHPVLDVLSSRKAGMVAIRVLKGKHQKEKCNSDFAVRNISEVGKLPILK